MFSGWWLVDWLDKKGATTGRVNKCNYVVILSLNRTQLFTGATHRHNHHYDQMKINFTSREQVAAVGKER